MSNGRVHLSIENNIAAILIDRPEARNAMTWAMYQELGDICSEIGGNPAIRAATIRGAGGEAFVAGTDIEQFLSFKDGADGIAYEKTIDALMARIEALPMPIVAIVEGWAIGGGLRFSYRYADGVVRRADRPHPRQLPVDGQLRARAGRLRPGARQKNAAAGRNHRRAGSAGMRLRAGDCRSRGTGGQGRRPVRQARQKRARHDARFQGSDPAPGQP